MERPGPNRGDSFIGFSGWDEIRRIDDHAELIDSETIRAAVRAIIEAIGTAEYVHNAGPGTTSIPINGINEAP